MESTARVLILAGSDSDGMVAGAAQRAGLQLLATRSQDLLARRDLLTPRVVVLRGHGQRQEREATQLRLQSHPALHGAPLVVIADEDDIDSFSGAITKGAAAFLVEPPDPGELADTLRRVAAWESRWARTEKRRRLRRPLLLRVTVEIPARDFRTRGLIVDVSSTGCRVESREPVRKGEEASVVLHTRAASTGIALGGTVRWERQGADGRHLMAVKFAGPSALLAGRLLGTPSLTEPRPA